jgi:hypothetical protein
MRDPGFLSAPIVGRRKEFTVFGSRKNAATSGSSTTTTASLAMRRANRLGFDFA